MTAAVFRTPEAAKYIGLSPSTLTQRRLRGDDCPTAVRLGARGIGFRVADLDAWIAGRSPSGDK
jgi:predicted DNA-binding transcriptional regulator AlpA